MGTQQLLLIILGVIIIGIAMTIGLSMFTANNVESNKNAIMHDIINVFAASAYQYYIRPKSLGGGDRDFTGYSIPAKLATNEDGIYTVVNNPTSCTITGTSIVYEGSVSATVGTDGKIVNWIFNGRDFL